MKQQRTTTKFEQLIFRWMDKNTHDISVTAMHKRFDIERKTCVYLIQLFNLNPDSDFKMIRTL